MTESVPACRGSTSLKISKDDEFIQGQGVTQIGYPACGTQAFPMGLGD